MAKHILIIDDEELIVKSLAKLLERNKYEVMVAKNGQDALIMLEEEEFDLIIADIRMPGINGVETIEAMQKDLQKKCQRNIPVIFITGYADEVIKEKAEALNPVAYLHKPFDISVLVDKVKEVLK